MFIERSMIKVRDLVLARRCVTLLRAVAHELWTPSQRVQLLFVQQVGMRKFWQVLNRQFRKTKGQSIFPLWGSNQKKDVKIGFRERLVL
mmetsp:Transcript_10362/g.20415  ORF Transcript_10362/g.20415 Transcript_10362/m.20415 type:complete len:89 (+) Transcript_10362:56-322(+)